MPTSPAPSLRGIRRRAVGRSAYLCILHQLLLLKTCARYLPIMSVFDDVSFGRRVISSPSITKEQCRRQGVHQITGGHTERLNFPKRLHIIRPVRKPDLRYSQALVPIRQIRPSRRSISRVLSRHTFSQTYTSK